MSGKDYRAKAVQLLAKAQGEANPHMLSELEKLARSYLRLAQQADANNRSQRGVGYGHSE